MKVFIPTPEMMLVSAAIENSRVRFVVTYGKEPTKVFMTTDLFMSFDVPLEINGLPVYEHPRLGNYVFVQ